MDCSKILFSEISFKPAPTTTITQLSASIQNHNNINNNNNGGAYDVCDSAQSNSLISNNSFKKINTNGTAQQATIISSSSSSSSSSTTTTTTATSSSLHQNGHNNNQSTQQIQKDHEEFRAPKHQLCDPSVIKLQWLQSDKIGGGLINMGNTCFLNSVLQCLTYCPPLYNFLLDNGGHTANCKINNFCMLCEMEKHIKRSKNSNGNPIKPVSIVQRLKYINKSFQFGRQEDAHEFLRYLLDHMWKACLANSDINIKASSKIDPKIKETTIINHIFGGYVRSQVLCLSCNSKSNTFDFIMDFNLEIRHAKSLEEALKKFTQSETLDDDNAYKCSKCKKKVMAKKKFTVYKAPNVATFQLKRFDSDRIFGGKITKQISFPEEFDLRPYMSDTSKPPIKYQLSAVLAHVGHSSNSGHYLSLIRNSNGLWYRMDDSTVSMVSRETVLLAQAAAYVLFYTRKASDQKIPTTNGSTQQLSYNISNKIKIIKSNNTSNHTNNNTNNLNGSSPIPQTNYNLQNIKVKKLVNGTSSNNKITEYLTPTQKNTSQDPNLNSDNKEPNQPEKNKGESSNTSPDRNQSTSENVKIQTKNGNSAGSGGSSLGSTLSTWFGGAKSKLEEDDSKKRKLNEMTERDRFNEELDQGKTKKIKSRNRDERFSNFSKLNPFQRFASNGYQQNNKNYNNNNSNNGNNSSNGNNKNQRDNAFQKHDGSFNSNGQQFQYSHNKSNNFRPRFDFHKSKFRHNGKHKSRHFNRRP